MIDPDSLPRSGCCRWNLGDGAPAPGDQDAVRGMKPGSSGRLLVYVAISRRRRIVAYFIVQLCGWLQMVCLSRPLSLPCNFGRSVDAIYTCPQESTLMEVEPRWQKLSVAEQGRQSERAGGSRAWCQAWARQVGNTGVLTTCGNYCLGAMTEAFSRSDSTQMWFLFYSAPSV